jgi:guanylate kinase
MEEQRPVLKRLDEFKQVLAHYHVSPHAQGILDRTQLVILTGLAGGGRNTIINRLVEQYDYHFIVSDTTRPPKVRGGVMERDGINYFFRTEEEVLRDLRNGEFLEAEIIHKQQVSGISVRELERASKSRKIAINEVEFGGANNIVRAKPDTFAIALLPPTYEEWIRRFRDREVIHEDEFRNRMHTAKLVLENALDKPYFKFVINDDIERCVEELRQIVEHDGYTDVMHQTGKRVAATILKQVDRALAA